MFFRGFLQLETRRRMVAYIGTSFCELSTAVFLGEQLSNMIQSNWLPNSIRPLWFDHNAFSGGARATVWALSFQIANSLSSILAAIQLVRSLHIWFGSPFSPNSSMNLGSFCYSWQIRLVFGFEAIFWSLFPSSMSCEYWPIHVFVHNLKLTFALQCSFRTRIISVYHCGVRRCSWRSDSWVSPIVRSSLKSVKALVCTRVFCSLGDESDWDSILIDVALI